jgi:23S rRNA (uracil1939-C5)-methyltransferase
MPGLRVTLELHGVAHGGDAVGRLPNGKACFVSYGIPGETVVVEVLEEKKRFARATVVEVLDPSPHRTTPPCPHFGFDRCGGCRLQHITPAHQADLLRRVVTEQLQRIGKIPDPPVTATVRPHPGDGLGYRNRARMHPDRQGRLGYRKAASHDVEHVPVCPLLEPAAQAARETAGDGWAGVEDVVARGDADGATSLEVFPGPGPVPPLPPGDTPVALVGTDGPVALRGDPVLTERVAGLELRVSPTSFFQASRAGAEALVGLVVDAAEVGPGDEALDCYAGVGLFSAALARAGADVTAVEGHPRAAEDAEHNLAAFGAAVEARPVGDVARTWTQEGRKADIVVLDPPRSGAGRELVAVLADLARRVVVYVSCDPAALARDAAALRTDGWTLRSAVPVDQFTHTAHVEVVATFRRDGP